MRGKMYGIGVGPGDPELLTLKALRIIEESDVVVVPGEVPEESVAYQIVLPVCPILKEKYTMAVAMPMIKNPVELAQNHKAAADKIGAFLDEGKQVAFLTLGDPTVYSTYIYVHQMMVASGYDTEIISGITSFCAVAARLNIGLVEKAEELHVIPASYQIEEALQLPGTKVLMKAGRKMKDVKALLCSMQVDALMIENCGMENEKIYRSPEEIPEDSSYFSLIIVKDK